MAAAAPDPPQQEHLYFAYGSNLHLQQMAARCPLSRFIGHGHLDGYVFQINSRGYANILPTSNPEDIVEGLIYLISSTDEDALDGFEGVPQAYDKQFLVVECFQARADLVARKVVEMVERNLVDGPFVRCGRRTGESVAALVYVSDRWTQNGKPQQEYVKRMEDGIVDALRLGLTEKYVDERVRPLLK